MPEENTSPVEQGTEVPMEQIPTDFREYNRWRTTGELPSRQGEKPAASAAAEERAPATGEPEPPAKTAPDSEPDDSQENGEPQEPPRPGSRQRKIDKLTRENAELLKRLEALEQKASPAPAPTPAPPAATGRPDLKDFTTLEEYTEALTEWKLDQREERRKADEQKRAAETAAQALQDSWSAKQQAAAQVHPDYDELMEATAIPVGPGVLAARQALLEEDHGAEILYWLASRPAELKRIAALTPARAILEIGKLAASLTAPASPETSRPKVSSAPRPPSPISHGTVKTTRDIHDENFARSDFRAWEKERVRQLKG